MRNEIIRLRNELVRQDQEHAHGADLLHKVIGDHAEQLRYNKQLVENYRRQILALKEIVNQQTALINLAVNKPQPVGTPPA